MKRLLIISAAIALLLTGCSKEPAGRDSVQAQFSVCVADAQGTKASFNGDGAAACVNRCKMQVLHGDECIIEESVQTQVVEGRVTARFSGIRLARGESYDFLFWADSAAVNGGKFSDLYYNTDDLTAVKMDPASYKGNLDSRDAFSKCVTRMAEESFGEDIILTRPFAQLNVITSDSDEFKAQIGPELFAQMYPCEFSLSFKAPTQFDVRTQETSEEALFQVTENGVYSAVDPATGKQCLTMDYILAGAKGKDLVDIAWSAKGQISSPVSHVFTNVPLQRNWRTNISGSLFTTFGNWKVEIEPGWYDPEYYRYYNY